MPHCACRRTHACSLLERRLSLTLEEAALRRAEAFAAAGRLSWSLWWFSFSQVENSQKEFLCMRGHFRAAWVPFEVTLLKLEVAVTSANSHTLYVFNVTFILTKLLLVTVRGQKYINITTEAAKFAKQCWLDCSHSLWDSLRLGGTPVPYASFGHITWIKQVQVLKSLHDHRGSQGQFLHFRLKHPEHHRRENS